MDTINAQELANLVANSGNGESCQQLQKSRYCRIAAGVRLDTSQIPTFFLEVTLQLSPENDQVDTKQMENALSCLKELENRHCTLTQ